MLVMATLAITLTAALKLLWLYAGAEYFKWRHDGAGGWLKNRCRHEVLKGDEGYFKGNMSGAADIVAFAKAKFEKPEHKPLPKNPTAGQVRTFENRVRRNHFVHVTAADLAAEDVQQAEKAVEGTQKIHGFLVEKGKAGQARYKHIVCPCSACRHGDEESCEYEDLKEPWKSVTIASKRVTEKRVTRHGSTSQVTDFLLEEESVVEPEMPAGCIDHEPRLALLESMLSKRMNVAFRKYAEDVEPFYLAQLE